MSQSSPWLSTNLAPASHEITFACFGPNSLKQLASSERLSEPRAGEGGHLGWYMGSCWGFVPLVT